jgi:hypothetical protein
MDEDTRLKWHKKIHRFVSGWWFTPLLMILMFLGYTANAQWKDRTWRSATATVITAEEMCEYRFGRRLRRSTIIPCSDFEQNLEMLKKYPRYSRSFFEAEIVYEDEKGKQVKSHLQIYAADVTRPRPPASEISDNRWKLKLFGAVIEPGDQYEIAHSRINATRVNLAKHVQYTRRISFRLVLSLIIGMMVIFWAKMTYQTYISCRERFQ